MSGSRIESRLNAIIETEQRYQQAVIDQTGDAPDGSNPLAFLSAIASAYVESPIDPEDLLGMMLSLQEMLFEDATAGFPAFTTAWTHTHYGRGIPIPPAEAIASVESAFNQIDGPALLITDEDAGFIPADVPNHDMAAFADTVPLHTPEEAIQRWFDLYADEDGMSGEVTEEGQAMRAAVEARVNR